MREINYIASVHMENYRSIFEYGTFTKNTFHMMVLFIYFLLSYTDIQYKRNSMIC
uniref:Uncharacterized protein n=1 Tax=Anguilla anguilla TaxID=7936 RepID=A0A0E9SNP2_ANGAN